MAVFHQMGHHSNNLIDLPQMSAYRGAILSPINCTIAEATRQIVEVRSSKNNFEIIFDPQLYVPASERGKLRKWPYFPNDFDTADLSSATWWNELNKKLANVCRKIKVNSICSPTIIPKVFDNKYYSDVVKVGGDLIGLVGRHQISVWQTVLASLAELTGATRALEVASIVSRTQTKHIFLVLVGTTAPRRELSDVEELKGAMRLIDSLEGSGLSVTVGFCSSDVLLWKDAGAHACASGKFFNLRRFTRERFEEPTEGGGQLPYWFEESLMAFLRQSDLIRVRKLGLLSEASVRNPFCRDILAEFDAAEREHRKPKPWLRFSWRQYLYWFADAEGRLDRNEVTAEELLTAADENWSKVTNAKILMEERENDGKWIRNWLNTIRELAKETA